MSHPQSVDSRYDNDRAAVLNDKRNEIKDDNKNRKQE